MTNSTPMMTLSLVLRGDGIVVGDISHELKTEATRAQNKGEIRILSSGKSVSSKTGFWVSSTKMSDSSLETHLEEINESVRRLDLAKLKGVTDAYLDLFVNIVKRPDDDLNYVININQSVISRVGKTNLPFIITISMTND